MGTPSGPSPVLLMLAAFSRYESALDWGMAQAQACWGPVALVSPRFEFRETEYYAPTMGAELVKQFFAFQALVGPERLAPCKLQTGAWEIAYASMALHPEARPLNLDAGYLTPAKLVLASTKDHAHRVYLERGIYAEVTLSFRAGRWEPWPWTYPDYRRADFHEFFAACRALLRRLPARGEGAGP